MSRDVRKPDFCICENKDADQLRGKLISAFVFATWIVHSLFFLNPKFQACSNLLWLYSPVCVGPGRKSRRLVFSQRGSYSKFHGKNMLNCININNFTLHEHLRTHETFTEDKKKTKQKKKQTIFVCLFTISSLFNHMLWISIGIASAPLPRFIILIPATDFPHFYMLGANLE